MDIKEGRDLGVGMMTVAAVAQQMINDGNDGHLGVCSWMVLRIAVAQCTEAVCSSTYVFVCKGMHRVLKPVQTGVPTGKQSFCMDN